VKLTLELDNADQCTIELPQFAGDRLKTMQDMCVLLDSWADHPNTEDKTNGS
jgi:hypothetical protein